MDLLSGQHQPPRCRFSAPASLAAVRELIDGANGDVVFVAGGQSIFPRLRKGLVRTAHLIDVTKVAEMKAIEIVDDHVSLGASVSLTEVLESEVAGHLPALAQAIEYVGTVTIRNRATVGGCLAWAEPRAEIPLALLAHEAVIETSRRAIPASEFFLGAGRSALGRDEVIVRAILPRPVADLRFGEILGRHSAGKAVVLVMVEVRNADIRVTCGGLVDRPVRSPWLAPADVPEWVSSLVSRFPLFDDPFHTWSYRAALVRTLVERAVEIRP